MFKSRSKKRNSTEKTIESSSFQEKHRSYTGELHWSQVIFRIKRLGLQAVLLCALLCGRYAFVVSVIHYLLAEGT